ncbi:MAG TPA: hypothetical protein VHY35_06220 [Stellaceae bacterium]|jgi:hypothetical protein|nr:hypothetical protein [Stellaceae bacterium]
MSTGTLRKPNSRLTRKPKLTKTNKEKLARPTALDIETWSKLLIPYPAIRLNMIQAFMGGHIKALQRHYDALSREPNCFVYRHPQQWGHTDALARSTVYGLDKNGYDALIKAGHKVEHHPAPHSLKHELLWCEPVQSIQLGAERTPGIEFASGVGILPETTRNLPEPFAVPVVRTVRRVQGNRIIPERVPGTSEADGFPFGVGLDYQGAQHWRFFLVQADADSEGIESEDQTKATVGRHMTDAIYIIENGIYESHFGFPNLYFIFFTPSAVHLENFKKHLRKLTAAEDKKWLRKYFLFHTFPATTTTYERPPVPTGHMLTEKYDRVDYPQFSFLTLDPDDLED